MTLPQSVKIGFRTYRVEEWEPLAAESSNRYGECSHIERVIRVATRYGAVQSAETLLHEILHGAWAVGSLKDGDDEERTVSTLSRVLTAVWIDNPGLLEWFAGATAAGAPA